MSHWWEHYPLRMIQTNLRETDMADMNAKAFARDLEDFGANAVLLNAAGIIASYETELEDQPRSAYLHGDSLGEIIEECHRRGIRVIARTDFSKIRYEIYEKHPDWAYRTAAGEIVNYNGDVHTCPNSYYQQEYRMEILREVLTKFPFDGVFFNMSGFLVVDYSGKYHGPCHCENCRRKFREMYGEELPEKDDPRDPVYLKYMAFKNRVNTELKRRIYETIKSIDPEIAVNTVDYLRTESGTQIGVPKWVYSASSNSRKSAWTNRMRLTDNACVDFLDFQYRFVSVSPGQMTLRQWQNLANAGNVSLYIMGRLDQHRDTSVFAGTREVFHFQKEHEEFYASLRSAAKVVLVHNGGLRRNDPEVDGWIRMLTESHVPFDELPMADLTEPGILSGKDVVILGDAKILSAGQAAVLDAFAEAGGTLIASGECGTYGTDYRPGSGKTPACLGIKKIREVRRNLMSTMFEVRDGERELFPHCEHTPLIAPGDQVILADLQEGARGYLGMIPEHPFGPPERCCYTEVTEEPGVWVYPYGKGKGICIPWMAGSFYYREGFENTRNMIRDVLFSLAGLADLAPELSPMAELNLCTDGKRQVVQLVNTSGCFANSFFDPIPMRDIRIYLPDLTPDSRVETLRGGRAKVEQVRGRCCVTLDELKDYEALIVLE